MTLLVSRTAASAGVAVAALAAALALSPPASAAAASDSGGKVSCTAEVRSSAASGQSRTTTRCTQVGRRVAPPVAARGAAGTGTSVRRGATEASGLEDLAESRGWVSTGLRFRNSTSQSVSVTIMYHDPEGCADHGDWATQGWWNVQPGGEVHVTNTSNRYAYFYAHSSLLEWAGPYSAYVTSSAFQSCVGIGVSTWRVVGEREVDLGDVTIFPYTTFTVNLTS